MLFYKPKQVGINIVKGENTYGRKVCAVNIDEEDWNAAALIASEYDSQNWKENPYRDGLFDRAELAGLLGEIAVAKIFGLIVNGKHIRGGDKVDFLINGKIWDVKNSFKGKGVTYVTQRDDYLGVREIKADYFVLCYLSSETNLDEKKAVVHILGFIPGSKVAELPIKRSPLKKSNHDNYVILHNNKDIETIEELYIRMQKQKTQQLI